MILDPKRKAFLDLSSLIILGALAIKLPQYAPAFFYLSVALVIFVLLRPMGNWFVIPTSLGFGLMLIFAGDPVQRLILAACFGGFLLIELALFWIWKIKNSPGIWRALACSIICSIGYVSGGEGGAGGWLEWLMKTFALTPEMADKLLFLIRKSIHFTFYGLLTLCIWQWIRRTQAKNNGKMDAIQPMVLCAGFAGFDELRQLATPGRTGLFTDVLIDLCGGAIFLLIGFTIAENKAKLLKTKIQT